VLAAQETFDFLNILLVHGFPKVMGVLKHIDKLKDAKRLRKKIEESFLETDRAKIFSLSDIVCEK